MEIKMKRLTILFFSKSLLHLLIIIQFHFVRTGTKLPCALTWTPGGYGYNHRYSVNAGVKNVVSRIAGPGPVFYAGYLDVIDGITYAVDGSKAALASDTYSVLTNKLNCSLEWIHIESDLDSMPTTAVTVDPNTGPNQLSYIGRAAFEGTYKSGATLPENSFLFASSTENDVLHFRNFEVLTSEQPSLKLTLSKFNFSNIDLTDIQSNSKLELFSATHANGEDGDRINYTIESNGVIDEYFNFVEGIADSFVGVSTIDLNMVMWFGAPAIKQRVRNVLNEEGKTIGILFERERHLEVKAEFQLASMEQAVGCAFAVILEDYEVPFTAKGVFIYDDGQNKIGQDQIRQILTDTGRDESTFVNLPDGSVQATISGILHGRFALRTYFLASKPRALPPGYGPCDGHLIP